MIGQSWRMCSRLLGTMGIAVLMGGPLAAAEPAPVAVDPAPAKYADPAAMRPRGAVAVIYGDEALAKAVVLGDNGVEERTRADRRLEVELSLVNVSPTPQQLTVKVVFRDAEKNAIENDSLYRTLSLAPGQKQPLVFVSASTLAQRADCVVMAGELSDPAVKPALTTAAMLDDTVNVAGMTAAERTACVAQFAKAIEKAVTAAKWDAAPFAAVLPLQNRTAQQIDGSLVAVELCGLLLKSLDGKLQLLSCDNMDEILAARARSREGVDGGGQQKKIVGMDYYLTLSLSTAAAAVGDQAERRKLSMEMVALETGEVVAAKSYIYVCPKPAAATQK